ncbi:MAG: iron-containing alcohol dehydrogenase [Alphaproteobacteria bacterium]
MALISYLTRILFDFGAVEALDRELSRHGIARPLLVADEGVRAAGLVDRVCQRAGRAPLTIFDRTPGNPTEAALDAALELYRQEGCDGIIALGGGSCLDLGKAAALLLHQGGSFADYQVSGGGSERIEGTAPWIAIPTAAGTGAEVGRAASLTLKNGHKVAAVSLEMLPHSVICDPELTLSLPAFMTAATGMDALSHGIEAFLSTRVNPPAGAIALDCVRRIAGNLERAVADGTDRQARWEMMMGALEGGMSLQKGLGAVHAMAHPLGELDLHHGTLNAVTMPAVLRFHEPVAGEKFARLREAAGLPDGADLAVWIEGLNGRIGMPPGLDAMGVAEGLIPGIAEAAAKDMLGETNPRPASAEDYAAMLLSSM